jgi:hypothetical protein
MGRYGRALAALICGFGLWSVGGAGAAGGAIPVCKPGQTSTKAKPCRSPVVSSVPDPGNIAPRHDDSDSLTIFRFLDPAAGKYQIEVDNTSGVGYINSFNWVPPAGMTITRITSTEGGHCALVPNPVPGGGSPMISCVGGKKGIAPPKCTCLTGGEMLVNFIATSDHAPTFNGKYWTYYGVVGSYTKITAMTPVPYHIPSVLPSNPGADLPLCKKGQVSTRQNPCLKA